MITDDLILISVGFFFQGVIDDEGPLVSFDLTRDGFDRFPVLLLVVSFFAQKAGDLIVTVGLIDQL
jgi:hypothetical protein